LRDFISIVESATGKKAHINILPDQPGDVPRTAADISKAKKLLGYNPKVSFEEGISRLVDWYRDEYSTLDEEPERAYEPPVTFQSGEGSSQVNRLTKSTSMLSFALGSHNEAGAF
jgi:dTDP-D-glucose 4,6-dehydratase